MEKFDNPGKPTTTLNEENLDQFLLIMLGIAIIGILICVLWCMYRASQQQLNVTLNVQMDFNAAVRNRNLENVFLGAGYGASAIMIAIVLALVMFTL